MAAFDLQEQEQIAELKAFWAKWGMLISGIALSSVIGFVGFKGWQYYMRTEGEKTMVAYAAVEKAFTAKDAAKTTAAAEQFVQKFPDHALATRAMLLASKQATESKDLAAASKALNWVIKHAKEDVLSDTAKLRLASIQFDQKQYDLALASIANYKTNQLKSQFSDLRGDILSAKGNEKAAKEAYQEALKAAEKDSLAYNLIEMKISAAGV